MNNNTTTLIVDELRLKGIVRIYFKSDNRGRERTSGFWLMSSIPITVNARFDTMSTSQGSSHIALQVYRMNPKSPSNDVGKVLGKVNENGILCLPSGKIRS